MVLVGISNETADVNQGKPISASLVEVSRNIFDVNMNAVNLRINNSSRITVAFGAALMLPILAYYLPAL
jgi:hypothetical protein